MSTASNTPSNDKKALKELVKRKTSGSVTVQNGVVHFHSNGEENRAVTFHTHYISRERGGYQPPSKIDLETFISHQKTHTHYIVTGVGIYVLRKVSCQMSQYTKNKIIRWVGNLQGQHEPGKEYHTKFVDGINLVCPRALRVRFVALGSTVPTPNEAKTVPTQACGEC